MAYERQKSIRRELDERIPRGARGSLQNELRFGFYFFRSQGLSFDTSLTAAVGRIREREPSFTPMVLPPPQA